MSKKKNRRSRKDAQISAPPVAAVPRNWVLGLILGLTFLAFSNFIAHGWAYDDTTQILENTFIRDLGNLPKALVTETWYWRVQQDQDPNKQEKPTTPYYRPVFTVYLMICWKLFGEWAPAWHVLNIAIHMLVVFLAFLTLRKISGDQKLAAIASLIFAIHPMRSESVAWVSGVTDPLLALFLIASFYFYSRFRSEGKMRLFAYSLLLFFLGAFTKEPAVALSIFIGAYELLVINRDKPLIDKIKPALKYSTCFLVVSVFYFVSRYYALGFALNDSNFRRYPLWQVLLTIPIVIWKYIGLMLWPVELSLFHATSIVKSPLAVEFLLPLAALIAVAFFLWRQLRGSTVARFGILWFAIHLLPVLNLSAFGEDFLVQERYVYVPSIGFSLLIAMALVKIPIENWLPLGRRAVARTALTGVVLLLLGGRSLAQNAVWKDDLTLWTYGAETANEQFMSHFILAHKLINLSDYKQAAEHLEECFKLSPNNLVVVSNLASTKMLLYQYSATENPNTADRAALDRALELCEFGLSKTTDFAPLWDTLGTICTFETGLKNYDRAIACFQRALALSPGNAMMNFHLGATLAKKGDLDNGARLLKTALDIDYRIPDAHKFLAYAYKAKGQIKEAVDELNVYLSMQPTASDAQRIGKDLQDMRAQLQLLSPQP